MFKFIDNLKDKFKANDFHLASNKKVKTLKSEFKENFGLTLRVYKGKQLAEVEFTLAELNSKTSKMINYDAEGLTIKSSMSINDFEKLVDEHFGLTVQVANEYDNYCINNKYTLGQAARKEDLKDWVKEKGYSNVEEWLKAEKCSTIEEYYIRNK